MVSPLKLSLPFGDFISEGHHPTDHIVGITGDVIKPILPHSLSESKQTLVSRLCCDKVGAVIILLPGFVQDFAYLSPMFPICSYLSPYFLLRFSYHLFFFY